MKINLFILLLSMASESDDSPSSYSSSSLEILVTPTPHEKNRPCPSRERSSYTPEKKKSRRFLFFGSPSTKEKISEMHHYQREQLDLQREMYYEQKVNSKRLSFIEQVALKFCGTSPKKDVVQPSTSQQITSSGWNSWEPSPQTPSVPQNSWERQPYWAPLRPYTEITKIEPEECKTPSDSDK